MRPVRAAAVVMVLIAALDGALDLIEYLTHADLWQVLLGTGVLVFIADLLVDRRTILGKWTYIGCEWLGAKVRYAVQWTIATSVGGGTIDPVPDKTEEKPPPKPEETPDADAKPPEIKPPDVNP